MPNNEDLARSWLASPHWGGWRVGMVDAKWGLVCVNSCVGVLEFHGATCPPDGMLPDLSHPGTWAFLLEDARRAWGPCRMQMMARSAPSDWPRDKREAATGFILTVYRPGFGSTGDPGSLLWFVTAKDEGEALIAALEAAP